MHLPFRSLSVLLVLMVCAASTVARGDDYPALLGPHLHEQNGVTIEYIYTGEVFSNTRGGLSTRDATNYRGLFEMVVTADLDEIGLPPGGTLFVYGQNGHGRGITEDFVGDMQTLSNIDAPEFTQISEYWWQRGMLDELVTVRLGKQDCNAEFAIVDLGGDFVNSSFGFAPTIPMPTYPDPSMAVVTFFQLTEQTVFKAGVWDGRPNGQNWGFSNDGKAFSIFEFKREHELGGALYGDVHVGIWYHGDEFDDVTPVAGLGGLGGGFGGIGLQNLRARRGVSGGPGALAAGDVYQGAHGVYFGFDQMLLVEDEEQGLGTFFQYGWAQEDRWPIEQYFGTGLVYKGLIRNRDEDVIGLGVAHAIFSDYLPDTTDETAIELFYKAPLTPWATIQPDFQYIASPSGNTRDAVVFGLRFEVVL